MVPPPCHCPHHTDSPHGATALTWSPLVPTGDKLPEAPAPLRLLPLLGVGALLLLAIAALGVLVARRRRQQSTLWVPEGFTHAKASGRGRREPLGQDTLGMRWATGGHWGVLGQGGKALGGGWWNQEDAGELWGVPVQLERALGGGWWNWGVME